MSWGGSAEFEGIDTSSSDQIARFGGIQNRLCTIQCVLILTINTFQFSLQILQMLCCTAISEHCAGRTVSVGVRMEYVYCLRLNF